jgi:hypothetical protein
MYVNFRQGIISYDTSIAPFSATAGTSGVNVTLNVGTQPFVITVANQETNYLWSEPLTVTPWQGLNSTGTYWLYIDFNNKSFVRTFGSTTLAPVIQPTAPFNPAVGQHWYNTATSQMYYWTGIVWSPVIRLFLATFSGPATIQSLSANTPDFRGTTVGDNTANYSGRVLFDGKGLPIVKSDGTFFTTEDEVFAQGTSINSVRLESNVYTAQSASPSIIPQYEAVAFNPDGTIRVASYNDAGTTAIGLSLQQFNFGGSGAVLLEGSVTNPNWNFTGQIGSLLWVSGDYPGTLQSTDPHIDNPVTYQIARVPVARVIGPTSIIFLQGIGTKGDPGPAGSASVPLATPSTAGTVLLSTDNGAFVPAATPLVISEGDPRLTDQRVPVSSSMVASNITVSAYTSSSSGVALSGNTQTSLQTLADAIPPPLLVSKGANWSSTSAIIAANTNIVYVRCPVAGTITNVEVITSGGPGSCIINIWKAPFASFPPSTANSICGSSLPSITNGTTYKDSVLSGWTTTINADDILAFVLTSSSTFTQIQITLGVQQ